MRRVSNRLGMMQLLSTMRWPLRLRLQRACHTTLQKETNMTQISAGRSWLTICAALAGLALTPAWAEAPKAEPPAVQADQHVSMAEKTFQNFMSDPGQDTFRKSLAKAKGVLIIPQSWRLGFIFGGTGGRGVLVVRDDTGKWSGPAFYTLSNGSIGLQIGFQISEVVVLAMTQGAIDSLLSSTFRGGVDAGIAAGPVGTGIKSSFQGDFLTAVRSQGLYGGLNLDGSMIKANDVWNQAYYSKPVSPADILLRHGVSNPKAEGLLNAVGDAVAHGADYEKTPAPKAGTTPAPKAETTLKSEKN
jgi:SH3 domain-containing YSC84-like protein 1